MPLLGFTLHSFMFDLLYLILDVFDPIDFVQDILVNLHTVNKNN
jgi:hypothetical protein